MKRFQAVSAMAVFMVVLAITKAAATPCVATWDEWQYNPVTRQMEFVKTHQATGNYGCPLGSFGVNFEKGRDVVAYSNGPSGHWTATGLGKYQCVEYVKRFYDEARGIAINQSVDWAVNFYEEFNARNLARFGFARFANGSGGLPQPGDIIVFDGNEPYGHVAIVTTANTSQVGIIEQNWSLNGRYTLSLTVANGRYTVAPQNDRRNYPVLGWLGLRKQHYSFEEHGANGWSLGYDTQYAPDQDPIDRHTWKVAVQGQNPGVVSPVIFDGRYTCAQLSTVQFSAKVRGNVRSTYGQVWVMDENNNWNHEARITMVDGVKTSIVPVDYQYHVYTADLSALGNIIIKQFSIELTQEANAYEEWIFDWVELRSGTNQNISAASLNPSYDGVGGGSSSEPIYRPVPVPPGPPLPPLPANIQDFRVSSVRTNAQRRQEADVGLGLDSSVKQLTLVNILAGTFTMGNTDPGFDYFTDELPAHRVTLSADFWIGKYEITEAQWSVMMEYAKTSSNLPRGPVSWNDCVTFLNRLSQMYGLSPAYYHNGQEFVRDFAASGFFLPTEAQWEYACRAGTTTAYWWGRQDDYSQYECFYPYVNEIQPVGSKRPNLWGLYDMASNAREWVNDTFGQYSSSPQTDPAGQSGSGDKVTRGCYWNTSRVYHGRSSYRDHAPWGNSAAGFRIAVSRLPENISRPTNTPVPTPIFPTPTPTPTVTPTPAPANLLQNPSAEDGTAGWKARDKYTIKISKSSLDGGQCFQGYFIAEQAVDISGMAAAIDAKKAKALISAWLYTKSPSRSKYTIIDLNFFDETGKGIGQGGYLDGPAKWKEVGGNLPIPSGTRTIVYKMRVGSDCYADQLFLAIIAY